MNWAIVKECPKETEGELVHYLVRNEKKVVSGQLEYRRQLTWRHGIVAWAGAGTMGPSLSSLNNGRWLPSAGVGYRFEFKPRVNVRLDYGIGNGSSGFYFQVGEAC